MKIKPLKNYRFHLRIVFGLTAFYILVGFGLFIADRPETRPFPFSEWHLFSQVKPTGQTVEVEIIEGQPSYNISNNYRTYSFGRQRLMRDLAKAIEVQNEPLIQNLESKLFQGFPPQWQWARYRLVQEDYDLVDRVSKGISKSKKTLTERTWHASNSVY